MSGGIKEVQAILDTLAQAREAGVGCMCYVRCASTREAEQALTTFAEQAGWRWRVVDCQRDVDSGHDMLTNAMAVMGDRDVWLVHNLPDPRSLPPDSPFYSSMADDARLVRATGGPRLVVILGLRQLQALVKTTPQLWAHKDRFVAWPHEAGMDSGTRLRSARISNIKLRANTGETKVKEKKEPVAAGHLGDWVSRVRALPPGLKRGRGYLKLGFMELTDGNLESATKMGQEAIAQLERADDAPGLAKTYELLAKVSEKAGNLAHATEWLGAATEHWQAAGNEARLAECVAKLGHLSYLQGNRVDARRYFQQAIAIEEALARPDRVAAGLRRLGLMAEEESDFVIAKRFYEDAIDLARRHTDAAGLSRCLHHLGRLNERLGNYEDALTCHMESLDLKQALEDAHGITASLHHLGNTHFFRGDLIAAERSYRQALEHETRLSDHHGRAATLQQLAEIAMQRDRHDEALALYLEAQWLWRRLRSPRHKALAQLVETARAGLDEETAAQVEYDVAQRLALAMKKL